VRRPISRAVCLRPFPPSPVPCPPSPLSLAAPALAQVPANDQATGAGIIPGTGPFPVFSSVVDVTNATTTNDPPAPSCNSPVNLNRSVWYRFTPTVSRTFAFSTLSTESATTVTDTLIAAYSSAGGASGPFTPLGCNDDTAPGTQSRLVLPVTAASEVWIVVWQVGFPQPATAGNVHLRVSEFPANDEAIGAEVIPGAGPFPYTTAVTDTDLATVAPGDPFPSCISSTSGVQRSVWFRFIPANTTRYTFFCSEEAPSRTNVSDTVLAVYMSAGAHNGPFTEVACNDDGGNDGAAHSITSSLQLTAGVDYYIVVWKFGTTAPTFGQTLVQLVVTVDPPPGDTAASARPLALGSTQIGYLNGAANDYELPSSGAPFVGVVSSATTAPGLDVVYEFTAPFAASYTFRVSDMRDNRAVLYLARTLPVGAAPQVVSASELIAVANRSTSSPGEEISNVSLNAGQKVFVVIDQHVDPGTSTTALPTSFKIEVELPLLEQEPNDTPATANRAVPGISGSILIVPPATTGNPDFYSLGTLPVGSRVFAMVDGGHANATDFDLRVTNQTIVLEADDSNNDIQFGTSAPNVAGTILDGNPAFLRVSYFSSSTQSEPYRLFFTVEPPSSAAMVETEPNDFPSLANAGALYYSGALAGPSPSRDVDVYEFQAQADDYVFVSLGAFPSRTTGEPILNGALEVLDAAGNLVQRVDDGATTASTTAATTLTSTTPNAPGEALVFRATTTGTYYARVFTNSTSTTTGAGPYLLSISVTLPPILRASAALTTFQTNGVNVPSPEQSYTFLGTDLTGDVTVTAPTHFQISTASGSGFGSTLTLPATNGSVGPLSIFVRYNPQAAPSPHAGNITHTSAGAVPLDLAVNGDLITTPTVQVNGGAALTLFRAPALNSPSPEQSYTVEGLNLTGNVTIAAPTHFEIATAAAGPYQSALTLTPGAGGAVPPTTVFVRYRPSTQGPHQGDITHTSAGAAPEVVTVAGAIPSLLTYPGTITGGGIAIPDNSPTAGIDSTVNVVQGGTVLGVRVKNLTILHTQAQDLDIFLIGPTGTQVELATDVGTTADNFVDTTFDDAAAVAITGGTAPFTGSFRPEQPLAAFLNKAAGGTWTLRVFDDGTTNQTGTLIRWELELETTAGPASAFPSIVVTEPRFGGVPIDNDGPVANGRDFGKIGIGTSARPLALTIRNPGSSPLNVAPLAATGTGAAHFTSSLTAQAVPAGGSATFTVTYSPSVAGVHDAKIVFSHDGTGVTPSPFQVAVRGEGTTATIFTQASDDVPKSIPDNNPTGVASTIAIPPAAGGAGRFIVDVNVTVDIQHSFDGDVDIFLVSPQNTQIELSTDNGVGGDHYIGTIFDDQAPISITAGVVPYTGAHQPEQPLGTLFNENAVGTWSLLVVDDASADTGHIRNWSLEITYSTTSPATFEIVDLTTNQVILAKSAQGAVPIDFGIAALGAPATRQLRIRNAGLATSSMSIPQAPTATPATEFDIVTGAGQFPATLAGGSATTFTIAFDPQVTGTHTADVSISHTAPSPGSPFIFEVKGRAIATAPVIVAATGLPIPIANPPQGGPPARTESTVNVTNASTLDFVVVRNLDITHDFLDDLTISLVHPDGTVVLLSNQRGAGFDDFAAVAFDDASTNPIATATPSSTPPAFTGTFKPEGTLASLQGKNVQGTWRLRIDDDTSGTVGQGTLDGWELFLVLAGPAQVPQIELRQGGLTGPVVGPGGTVALGTVNVGTPTSATIFVRNPGNALLTVNSISLTANAGNVFGIGGATSFNVAAGGSQSFEVLFTPTAASSFQGTVRVIHTASGTASPLDFTVTGSGGTPPAGAVVVTEGAILIPSGAAMDLGTQGTGSGPTPPRVLTIRNTGTAPLTGLVAVLSGADPADFSVSTLPPTLAPNASANLAISFDPTAEGARSATLTILNSAPSGPHTLSLTGTGTFSLGGLSGTGIRTPSSGGGGGGGCYMHEGKGANDLFFPVALVLAAVALAVRRLRPRAARALPALVEGAR